VTIDEIDFPSPRLEASTAGINHLMPGEDDYIFAIGVMTAAARFNRISSSMGFIEIGFDDLMTVLGL